MGKVHEEHGLSSTAAASESSDHNAGSRCTSQRFFGLRCALVLLFSAAVVLPAIFWLPPFLRSADQSNLDPDSRFRDHDIVASFKVEKPVSLLEDNILQLVNDIFDEINIPTTNVVIISLEPSFGSNITEVVFAVNPDPKYSEVSATAQSLIRASFESLVIRQSYLRLTTALFGYPFQFEVLKFPGGFAVNPRQSAFLLQKVQILFNFTLNFSIYQIQENFDELTIQLKSGLHLARYENLYISLTNLKGSTVVPPTTVQSSVLLAIGNTPSTTRLKQLAQTITDSHARNLGLNHTVFGRVKQVRLSSFLRHSLHGGERHGSPAPTPLPHITHQYHHHHHQHHHNPHLSPASAPGSVHGIENGSPRPQKSLRGPVNSYNARPPSCRNGNKGGSTGKARKQPQAPAVTPMMSPHSSAVSPPPPSVSHRTPASRPWPSVTFSGGQAPSKSKYDAESSHARPSMPPFPSSSPVGILAAHLWLFPLLLALGLHL